MQYTVNSSDDRHFEVSDEQRQLLGRLDYTSFLPGRARITTGDNNIYDITPDGFWQTTKAITRNGEPYAEVKPNPGNGLILSWENGPSLFFKKKSFWSNDGYLLTDEDDQELASVRGDFRWSEMTFGYTLELADSASPEARAILPLLLIYCIKEMRLRSM